MPKPITPLVGADTFVVNEDRELCLIRRADNGLWALPGGCQELNETPAECACREYYEETGLIIKITRCLGVFSSLKYEYKYYPYKDNVFVHLLFAGKLVGGTECKSDESISIKWFTEQNLPELSDGHSIRINYGFRMINTNEVSAYFE